ncbi:MAG: FAD-dependent oxidoreductase [Candidatus Paceibacterota bacterium]
MYDLIIVGGGPAAVAAGIYASRKKIKTLLIAKSFGGQSTIAAEINNFIGIKSISGVKLAEAMEEHLRAQDGIDIKSGISVSGLEKKGDIFMATTDKNEKFESKTLLIAVGSRYRRLNVPGEKEFEGKGVSYCSICDAPLFKDKTVAVIGGGNSGLGAVIDLLPYVPKIYLIEFTESLKGDQILQEKIKNNPKVRIITMAAVQEVLGDNFVKGLKYQDRQSEEIKRIELEGIFVSIGYEPNSDLVKDLVELNKYKQIIIDHKTQKTSQKGIWAAGDITDVLYKQNNVAIGDGIKAVLNIYDYLRTRS